MTVLERFEQGEIRALSRIISFVENREEGYQELLGKLYPKAGRTVRVGVTGPPGAGKSTIVNRLADIWLKAGKRVGMIAVDPTSPFTGGALLGDRVRVDQLPTDGTAFFRSMATRGATGGLASATNNVALIYDAFGFDITLIETVGVGQVELDVIDSCDSVVVVLVPESGDAVQTMKSGLMEIANIFCINKSDRPGSERMAGDLKQALQTRKQVEGAWTIPIISTEGLTGKNIDQLHQAITEHLEFMQSTGRLEAHRMAQLKKKILSILKNRFEHELIDSLDSRHGLAEAVDTILTGQADPYRVADELYRRFTQ